MKARICIVGTGYVGMASAIGLAELGWDVVGYDVLPDRISGLRAGVTPYKEAGIDELLHKHLATNRISFVEDFGKAAARADFIVLTVGTPAAADGSADLSGLHAAVDAILVEKVPTCAVVVLRSTVPIGTSEMVASRLSGYTVIYAPEFLREGSAIHDFLHPDRIVVGANDHDAAIAYARLFEALKKPVVFTSLQDAELIKGFSNAFLATKISFANEVANFCAKTGANSDDVLRGMGYDSRIGEKFLAPGIGFGGPCFEKDVKSLHHVAGNYGAGRDILSAVLAVNKRQPRLIVELLERELGTLDGAAIGIWGLAFKAGTSDVRDSLALRIVEDIIERGASVRAYDPAVHALPTESQCVVVRSPLEAADADALLILTEWPVFASIDPATYAAKIRRRIVVDGRNLLDPERVAEAGLTYRGVGRSLNDRSLVTAQAV
ncbi:MAG: UDP-glucose dehydrogenase family protein [Vulcanimicrobiaceae bacterium]